MSQVLAPNMNTSPVSGMTDEQQDFVEAIRDFAKRETGTAEKRSKLTDGYLELHNFEISRQLGELGYLGASAPEEYGGTGGGMVDACLFLEESFRGLLPLAGYPVTLITAGAVVSTTPSTPGRRPRRADQPLVAGISMLCNTESRRFVRYFALGVGVRLGPV